MNKKQFTKDTSPFPLLNNKEWLYQKYLVEKLNTEKIAKLVGCANGATISRNLKKFNIPMRSYSERKRNANVNYLKLNMPVINGSLLGDAFITKQRIKNGSCGISKRNIHYNHLLYFASKILTKIPESRIFGPYESSTNLTPNGKPVYFLNTFKLPEIAELRNKWYPNGIKIIPKDIVLTKESLLHWFLDDGYSYFYKQRYKTTEYKYTRVFFCTNNFTKKDLEWLCVKLKNEFNLKFTLSKKGIRKDGTQSYLLKLSDTQVEEFFKLIGKCPVKELEYKWKIV